MTTVLLLNIMAETGKTLAELVAEQPQYFIEKGKIECPDDKKEASATKDLTNKLKTKMSALLTESKSGLATTAQF